MTLPRLELRALLFIILGLTLIFGIVIRDPDFYFHLRAGHDILQQWSIPSTDPYSFTHQGGVWHAHEWLFEVIIYLIFTGFGYLGVKLFIALLGIAALLLVAKAVPHQRNLDLPIILITTPLLFPFLTPRPQLFTFLFLALYLFALLRDKYRSESGYLKWLPLAMVIWVNVHGAYLLGIALLAAFLFTETLAALLNGTLNKQRAYLRRLLITLLLVAGASLLNPWGINHWLFPFHLMDNSAVAQISEWQPINFSMLLTRAYLVVIALLFIVYLYGPRRPDLTELLIPWLFIAASFLKVRHMPLACLAMLPFFNLRLAEWISSTTFQVHPLVQWMRQRLSGGKELGGREQLFNAVILVILLLLFTISYRPYHADDEALMNKLVPVQATDFIVQAGLSGRMFNAYHYGGYLLFRLYPQQRVFIDIRGDMYSKQLMDDYSTIHEAHPGWQQLLERYAIDYIVCEQDALLVAAATASGLYLPVYRDDDSVVLVRDSNRYRSLIARYQPTGP